MTETAFRPGIGVGELLDTLLISKQALNAPLRQLVEMDLVRREASPEDGRAKRLRLSRSGHKLEAQLTGVQMELLERAFEAAPRRAAAHWLVVMHALVSP